MDPLAPDYYELPFYSVNDVAEAWGLNYHLFNILKYSIRAYKKNGLQDISKAFVYLRRLQKLNYIPRTTTQIPDIDYWKLVTAWIDHIDNYQLQVLAALYSLRRLHGGFQQLQNLSTALTNLEANIKAGHGST